MNNAEYYIWIVKCLGAGNIRSQKIIEFYDDIKEFYYDCKHRKLKKGLQLTEEELECLYKTNLEDVKYVFERYEKFHTQYITIKSQIYPKLLRNIDNPPLILFVVGDISHLDDELLLTVVGTRKESLYGKRVCEVLCSELCSAGFSIVSGLAKGGDTTAHETAIKCHGRTYGFLACGLDVDYPHGKLNLKNQIYKHGAVITEYLPGTTAYPENFHIRNRLMSGISVGTLVIEAPKRSGTLITANNALNQGRDVFAVPASIFWKNSFGIIDLLQNGAKPVRNALDIIEEYIGVYPEKIKIAEETVTLNQIFDSSEENSLKNENSNQAISNNSNASEYKRADKKAKNEIKSNVKKLIKNAEEDNSQKIISVFSLEEKIKSNGYDKDQNIIKVISLLENKEMSIDELVLNTDLPASKIMIICSKLEIAEIARRIPGNRIELLK